MFRIIKSFFILYLIFGTISPTVASVNISDGAAFVTRSEFSKNKKDLAKRILTIENSLDTKIDDLVSTYLSRNGVWDGVIQKLEYENKIDSRYYNIGSVAFFEKIENKLVNLANLGLDTVKLQTVWEKTIIKECSKLGLINFSSYLGSKNKADDYRNALGIYYGKGQLSEYYPATGKSGYGERWVNVKDRKNRDLWESAGSYIALSYYRGNSAYPSYSYIIGDYSTGAYGINGHNAWPGRDFKYVAIDQFTIMPFETQLYFFVSKGEKVVVKLNIFINWTNSFNNYLWLRAETRSSNGTYLALSDALVY